MDFWTGIIENEIRYRNKLTFFHKSIYLYKSPQNRMVARFFEIIKV